MFFSKQPIHSFHKAAKRGLATGLVVALFATFGSSGQSFAAAVAADVQPVVFAAGIQNANPTAYFYEVKCASVGNCTAVGSFKNAAGDTEAFTTTSTNGVWANAQPAVFAAGVQNTKPSTNLGSVSCPSAGNCTAAGNFKNAAGDTAVFTTTSTNGVWANAQPAVFAAGIQNTKPSTNLSSVSCPSVGNCTAVGGFNSANGRNEPFTMTSTNGVWANAQPAVFDAGVQDPQSGGYFSTVSCGSAGNCTAAGTFTAVNGSTSEAFTMTSTNGVWAKAEPAVFAAGARNASKEGSIIRSVSCASVGNCTTAGSFTNASGNNEAFTMTSTNGVWAKAEPAKFAAGVQNAEQDADLFSVSCVSAGNCTAVGTFTNATGGTEAFTTTSTNGVWANAEPAVFAAGVKNAEQSASYSSITCASAGNCTAAGNFRNASGGTEAFTTTSTNGVWAKAEPAKFAAGVQNAEQSASYSSIACASAGNCTAVGYFKNASGGTEAFTTTVTSTATITTTTTTTVSKTTTSLSTDLQELPSTGFISIQDWLAAAMLMIVAGAMLLARRRRFSPDSIIN